jgi:hypothetical protein
MNYDDNRGVWIGAILLLAALVLGIVCGARVMEGTASREAKLLQARLTEAEIQRDAAVEETAFWQMTLKQLVDGGWKED